MHAHDFDSIQTDKILECALYNAMTPPDQYKDFWKIVIGNIES